MPTYDVGDQVHVSTTVFPAGSNSPANATMAIAVTRPDLSAAPTPSINNDGVGQYSADVPVTAAGNWLITWSASGAVVGKDEYQFFVQPPGFRIVSLTDAKVHINKTMTYTGDDNELRGYIDTAGELIESLAGPVVNRTVVEYHNGGNVQIFPRLWPVMSITSIVESWPGGPNYTLNQMADLGVGGSTGFDFTFDPVTGAVTRRVQNWEYPFPGGVNNIKLTYVAGRAQPWPAKYRMAALAEISWLWRLFGTGRGAGRPSVGMNEETVAVPGFGAVPVAVVSLIGTDLPPQAGA